MGVLIYDGERFDFDDRTLAHLQAVITVKLRRREPFLLTWRAQLGAREVRSSVWIDNAIPLRYEVDPAAAQPLNQAWLDGLMDLTTRASGLVVFPEPEGKRIPRRSVARSSSL